MIGDADGFRLVVPWPPSVNRYWRSVAGRSIISAEGREYRQHMQRQAMAERWPRVDGARVGVMIEAWPPDKRRRDLDNLPKALLDGLTHCGVWLDDSQIDDLRIVRRPVGGHCVVYVAVLEGSSCAA